MGQPMPAQHPSVVLRSHYNLVRALLAMATAAVVALSVAVAIVADDENQVTRANSDKPLQTINYKGFSAVVSKPQAAPLPLPKGQGPNSRYDGGPEEGTRSPLTSRIAPNSRYDGGPDEGTRGPQRAPQGGSTVIPQGPGAR